MYTQQSNALASALRLPAGQQQNQAIMQVFANCIQGLRTNGPMSVNGAARNAPPRAGVINSPPGLGAINNRLPASGNSLQDYSRGYGDRNFNEYPPNTWNTSNFGGGNSYITNSTGGDFAPYFGGDTAYGGNYLTQNLIDNSQNYNSYNAQNYNSAYNVDNSTNTSVNQNNISNWNNNQFTDSSYNDFSTILETTQNSYDSTTNNFGGDSYFDNTVTEGTTVNLGPVNNSSTVTNQGDVYNEGDTYNAGNTFVNIGGVNVNLSTAITNIVNNILNGPRSASFTGRQATINVPVNEYDLTGDPPTLTGAAPTLTPSSSFETIVISVPVNTYTFNSETCSLDSGTTEVEVEFDVPVTEYAISGGAYTLSGGAYSLSPRAVTKNVKFTPAGTVRLQ